MHLWGLSTVGLDMQECWSVALDGNPNLRWRLFMVWASGCYRIWYQCYPVNCCVPAGILGLHNRQSELIISLHTSPPEQNSEEKWKEGVWCKLICPYRLKRHIWSLKKDRSGWKRRINVKNETNYRIFKRERDIRHLQSGRTPAFKSYIKAGTMSNWVCWGITGKSWLPDKPKSSLTVPYYVLHGPKHNQR